MTNSNQTVRTCILRVDVKCCTGCQIKASKKLKTISGVTETEYNQEKGLMRVTGNVEPMALVDKLTKCGKKTELVSVKYQLDDADLSTDEEDEDESSSFDTSSTPDPKTMDPETYRKIKEAEFSKNTAAYMEKGKNKVERKSSLFGWLRRKPDVVEPVLKKTPDWRISSHGLPDSGPRQPQVLMTPYGPYVPMTQQQAHIQMMTGTGRMPNNGNSNRPPPQQTQPEYIRKAQPDDAYLHYEN